MKKRQPIEEVFSYELFRKAQKPTSLWTKFLLLFRPLRKSVDISDVGKCELWFKDLFGITYIINLAYKEDSR